MRIVPVLVAMALCACGGKSEEQAEQNEDPIGASYHEALDKADEVNTIVEEQAEAVRKEIDEADSN